MEHQIHVLDSLKKHYKEDGQIFYCNYCEFKSSTAAFRMRRRNFKRHLLSKLGEGTHPSVYSEHYEMTNEDFELRDDFEKLGIPAGAALEFRKMICYNYNYDANGANFAYIVLSRKVLGANEMYYRDGQRPWKDPFLQNANQLTRSDFATLPGYDLGHILGRSFLFWSRFFHDAMNNFSIVAYQHEQLNRFPGGYWTYLENCAIKMTLTSNVRVLAGTSGELDLLPKCKPKVPRWWYMIILISDEDDSNWRYSAFIFPNIACTNALTDYEVTIEHLRALTGFDFFRKINDELKTLHKSVVEVENFETWAMAKWFPDYDEGEESDEDVGPSRKKKKVLPIECSDDSE